MLTCAGAQGWQGRRRLAVRTAGIAVGAVALFLGIAAQGAQALPEEGCHLVPSVYCLWDGGDQRLDLGAETRFRIEVWDARAGNNLPFALPSAQLSWIARRTPDDRARVEVLRHLRDLERLFGSARSR